MSPGALGIRRSPSQKNQGSSLIGHALPPLIAAVVGFAAWEIVPSLASVPAYLLPRPSAVLRAALSDPQLLVTATATTALSASAGFVLSALVGVALAILLAASRTIERGLYPYAVIFQTVPIVAIAPLLVLWFGVGARAVTASAFIVSVFPVITNALAGFRAVDPSLRDLFQLYGASRFQRLFKLELPAATPSIATGLRVSSGLSVIGAIVGEFVAGFAEGKPGLGIVVMTSYRQLRTDLLFAAVGCSTLLGMALFGAVSLGAHFLLRRWHVSEA
ncbi:MAG: ABC transporter permease [Polyangiales bacterium]